MLYGIGCRAYFNFNKIFRGNYLPCVATFFSDLDLMMSGIISRIIPFRHAFCSRPETEWSQSALLFSQNCFLEKCVFVKNNTSRLTVCCFITVVLILNAAPSYFPAKRFYNWILQWFIDVWHFLLNQSFGIWRFSGKTFNLKRAARIAVITKLIFITSPHANAFEPGTGRNFKRKDALRLWWSTWLM